MSLLWKIYEGIYYVEMEKCARSSQVLNEDLLNRDLSRSFVAEGYEAKRENKICGCSRLKKIKAEIIIWEKRLASINSLTFDPPPGIELSATGRIVTPFDIRISDAPPLNSSFSNNTLVIDGFIPVRLIFRPMLQAGIDTDEANIHKDVYVPISEIISGINLKVIERMRDNNCNPKINVNYTVNTKSLQSYPTKFDENIFNLIISLALIMDISMSSEEIISIKAY